MLVLFSTEKGGLGLKASLYNIRQKFPPETQAEEPEKIHGSGKNTGSNSSVK